MENYGQDPLRTNGNDWEKILKDAFYSLVTHKTSIVLWVADQQLNLIYTNKNFLQHFEAYMQPARSNVLPKVPEALINAFDKYDIDMLEPGECMEKDVVLETTGGTNIIFHAFICPVECNNERFIGGHAMKIEHVMTEANMVKQKEISDYFINFLEKERKLIGQELHDNINQTLALVTLFVKMLTPFNEEEVEIKDKVLKQLKCAMDEIGSFSRGLVIPRLKTKGLVASIRELIENIHASKALSVDFHYDRLYFPISSGKEVAIFRILQEQLRNIMQHSLASNAVVRLYITDDHVVLLIEDNGVGFDAQKQTAGIGLSNIRERVTWYEGTVNIQTAVGKGCKVIAKIPVNI
jgi:signal transduction histidine kinase